MQLGYAEDLTFSTWEVMQEDLNHQALESDYLLILKIQDLANIVPSYQLCDCKITKSYRILNVFSNYNYRLPIQYKLSLHCISFLII